MDASWQTCQSVVCRAGSWKRHSCCRHHESHSRYATYPFCPHMHPASLCQTCIPSLNTTQFLPEAVFFHPLSYPCPVSDLSTTQLVSAPFTPHSHFAPVPTFYHSGGAGIEHRQVQGVMPPRSSSTHACRLQGVCSIRGATPCGGVPSTQSRPVVCPALHPRPHAHHACPPCSHRTLRSCGRGRQQ